MPSESNGAYSKKDEKKQVRLFQWKWKWKKDHIGTKWIDFGLGLAYYILNI